MRPNWVKQSVYAFLVAILLTSVQAFGMSLVSIERKIGELESKFRSNIEFDRREMREIERALGTAEHASSPNLYILLARITLLRLRLLERVEMSLQADIRFYLGRQEVPEPLKSEILSEIKKRLESPEVPFGNPFFLAYWRQRIYDMRQGLRESPLFHCQIIYELSIIR